VKEAKPFHLNINLFWNVANVKEETNAKGKKYTYNNSN